MNDDELDRLLDAWEPPPPPVGVRKRLRARLPQAEQRRFTHWRRWALLIAVASATLAISLGQSTDTQWPIQFTRLYDWLIQNIDIWRAGEIRDRVRLSDPKVYVDEQLVSPPNYGPAAKISVSVPGDGVYSIISVPGITGWVENGRIHGSVIEFKAGNKQVRIECNKPIVQSDLPVFVRHQP
ncbi:MAG TPA: hypothetical protein VKB88_08175 [Bryobacteraceae bacterium]|nr:hypothetical protein [Bryobacteraceae bacterium]